jgi:O-antigen/teichoic acid export membrane protein
VFPGYAKLQHDRRALQRGFLGVAGLIAMVAVPAGIGMAAVAHLFVPAVLGAQWLATVPLISVLAIGGTIYVLAANNQSLYFAVGRPRFRALLTLAEIAVFLPLVAVLIRPYGLLGAAVAFTTTAALVVPVNFTLAARLLHLRFGDVVAILWRPVVASALMAVAVLAAFPRSAERIGTWANVQALAAAIALGALVYALVVYLAWRVAGRPDGAERWLLDRCLALWQRLRK